jgi:hypothetical protein
MFVSLSGFIFCAGVNIFEGIISGRGAVAGLSGCFFSKLIL